VNQEAAAVIRKRHVPGAAGADKAKGKGARKEREAAAGRNRSIKDGEGHPDSKIPSPRTPALHSSDYTRARHCCPAFAF